MASLQCRLRQAELQKMEAQVKSCLGKDGSVELLRERHAHFGLCSHGSFLQQVSQFLWLSDVSVVKGTVNLLYFF